MLIKSTLAELYATANNPEKSQRVATCGNLLEFKVFEKIDDNQQVERTLKRAIFCNNRFCPMCAWRKSRKVAGEMKSIFSQIQKKQKIHFLFLTLTVKNCALIELRDTIQHMSKSFKRLSETAKFKKSVLGFVRTIEFLGDKTPKGEAHPHFHTLLLVKNNYFKGKDYISQKTWRELWQQSLRVAYIPSINIKRIKPKNEEWTDVDSAIFETIKYCVAPIALKRMTATDFMELDKQVSNIRQYNLGGLVKSTEPTSEDELDSKTWKLFAYEFYKWLNDDYKLTLKHILH